mgnify:CR=1 FL=1
MLKILGYWLLVAVIVALLFGLFAKAGRGKP